MAMQNFNIESLSDSECAAVDGGLELAPGWALLGAVGAGLAQVATGANPIGAVVGACVIGYAILLNSGGDDSTYYAA
jgi:hypothetical protein